ncbi:MAG TPA: hypothetical protein VFQ16_06820 [Burkholderiaceae bacterium]|nr:hypothetical protein [Burkholderiaceae bacterium]
MHSRGIALFAGTLLACAPALDWREVRPPGANVQVQLPCKPAIHARQVTLAGAAVEMSLYACSADGVTYALSHADIGDPARVGAVLDALARSARANLGGGLPRSSAPARVEGMTPIPLAVRLELDGHLPDGRPARESVVVFAYGTRVYQATALGAQLDPAALDTFLGSLRVRP